VRRVDWVGVRPTRQTDRRLHGHVKHLRPQDRQCAQCHDGAGPVKPAPGDLQLFDPIGRVLKGSLAELRPDDLAAQLVEAVLGQIPGLPRDQLDDLILGCGRPGGEQGFNLGEHFQAQLAPEPPVVGSEDLDVSCGHLLGPFDEFAVLESSARAYERDQVWCVHGASVTGPPRSA
jgi:hypothetical protein